MFLLFILCLGIFTSSPLSAKNLKIGHKVPSTIIEGKNGGLVDSDKPFNVKHLAGKVQIIWYVDPDEKDLNDYAVERLRKEKFPLDQVGSVAIINFDATVIPNWILAKIIANSQDKNKNTLYVKDMKKILVKEWGMKDDSSNLVVLSENLKVLYWYGGKLDKKTTDQFLEVVRKHISQTKRIIKTK